MFKKNYFWAIIIFIISFLLYLFTMPKGIYTGDSGEIATAVAVWGVAHPTGFPLYIILAKLFSYLLPTLEFAYRLNIFSALAGALTSVLVYLILIRFNLNKIIAIITALTLSVGYTFWSHATVVRVYSLAGLFFTLTICLFFYWKEKRDNKTFYLLAIILGLGMGTHLTFILAPVFILIYAFLKERNVLFSKKIIGFLLLFIISFVLIYSYIPFRASLNPALNWGGISSYQEFANYITQKDYAYKIGNRSLESWSLFLGELVRIFSREFNIIGFLLIIIGVVITFIKRRAIFYSGIAVIILNILLLANYGNGEDIIILYRYFLPTYIIFIIFLAFGLDFIFKNKKYAVAGLVLPFLIFLINLKSLDRHNNILVSETMENILSSVPKNSILITIGDSVTGPIMYKQLVLGERKDLVIIDDMLYSHDWYNTKKKKELENQDFNYKENISQLINANLGNVYSVTNSRSYLKRNFNLVSNGLVYKILEKDGIIDIKEIKKINQEYWQNRDLEFLFNNKLDKEPFSLELINLYTIGLNNYAADLVNNGLVEDGIKIFKKSLSLKENSVALYNLSGIYDALGNAVEANKYKQRLESLQK